MKFSVVSHFTFTGVDQNGGRYTRIEHLPAFTITGRDKMTAISHSRACILSDDNRPKPRWLGKKPPYLFEYSVLHVFAECIG